MMGIVHVAVVIILNVDAAANEEAKSEANDAMGWHHQPLPLANCFVVSMLH